MENEVTQKQDPRASKYPFEKGRYIIKLKYPFEYGSETFTELKLRPPKAKHMRKLKAEPDMQDMIRMVEVLSDEARSVIDELDPVDTSECVDFLGNFF